MRQNLIIKTEVRLKAYSLKELCIIYECSPKTMRTWIKPLKKKLGSRNGHYYTPKQVRIIFERLGLPGIFSV